MTSAVLVAVADDADGAPPPGHVPAHRCGHQALSNHTRELPHRPHPDTDDRTTTAPSALHHDHDQLPTIATTAHSTATNHDLNRSRHWHPAVPFPGATVPATGEGPGPAPC